MIHRSRWTVVPLMVCAPLAAQEPDSALADRVRRLEMLVVVLQQQVAQQAGGAIASRSGMALELSGVVLVNGFFTNAKVNTSEAPQLVAPPDPPGALPVRHVGATARQTRLSLNAFHPDVLGAAFSGEVDLDFFGGQLAGGRSFPLARLRRVRADLVWPNAWLMVGQDAPPIAELNPSSLAAVGLPEFTLAGNLWLWLPQVRAGVSAGRRVRLGLEVAALAPTDGSAQGVFFTQPDRAERSRRPFVQARLLVRWEGAWHGELSLGGHAGWIAVTDDSTLGSRALAAAARFTLTPYVEIRGEAFAGQGLGVLGGGGAGQTLGVGDVPVTTRGGWVQLNVLPAAAWELGGGIGFDNPDDADVDPVTGRLANRIWEAHVHWRPAPLIAGVTFRRLETTYPAPVGARTANHVNLGVGFAF